MESSAGGRICALFLFLSLLKKNQAKKRITSENMAVSAIISL
jgi:hypothetical protein